MPRALGALALRRADLRVLDVASGRRSGAGFAARSAAGGPATLPEAGGARREPRHLPCEAAPDQRSGEPSAGAPRRSGAAIRGSRRGADECAADHEGLAGVAAHRSRRQGAEGHLCDGGSGGGGCGPAGERPILRGAGAAEAHSALQRHHLRFGAGADPEGESLVVRCGVPALYAQASLYGLLPGHQQRAFERPVSKPGIPRFGPVWSRAASSELLSAF